MSGGRSDDSAWGLQESYARYKVYDQHYEEVGKVDDLFVDANDRPTYLGVKMGFLGTKYTLIPVDIARVNDRRELVEVAESKEVIENAPDFGDVDELTPDREAEIRDYYRLSARGSRESSEGYSPDLATGRHADVDLEYGERRGAVEQSGYVEHSGPTEERRSAGESSPDPLAEPRPESVGESREELPREGVYREEAGSTPERDDELRIQRTEEELRAGTREREAGEVNVRKRVRTDREQVRVPKKREEVIVERIPAESGEAVTPSRSEGAASPSETGEEEIRIPVVEEEVVVEKRPVVKEEIRLRKRVVEEEAVVEDEVRKEEVEVDETDYRDRR